MIIGVLGHAGAGKDTIGDILVQHAGFVKVSFADPMKRFVVDVFGFSPDQVWGRRRDEPDPRWNGLTPRRALQLLGTEWGRACHPEVWTRYGIEVALAIENGWDYFKTQGLVDYRARRRPSRSPVFCDVRFANEVAAIKKAGGKVIKVVRPGMEGTIVPEGEVRGVENHRSEVEQDSIPDSEFDAIIVNDGTLDALKAKVAGVLNEWWTV